MSDGSGDFHRVVFTPSGLSGEVPADSTVLDAARNLGVDLDSVCGGLGICGRCQIATSVGSFPKWEVDSSDEHLSPPGPTESEYSGRRPLKPGARLGCQAVVLGDVVIDIPPESQIHRPVVRKEVDLRDLSVAPLLSLHYVEVQEAVSRPAAVLDVLVESLETTWNMAEPGFSPTARQALEQVEIPGSMTIAVRSAVGTARQPEVVAAWPGFVDVIGGVAIDIGSTTIAGHLCDLATGAILASAGRMNPQIRLGEDLMSRVSYAMMNPNGAEELTHLVRSALGELISELGESASLELDRILDVVLVGNSVMHHLVLGLDPTPLGQAPFTLELSEALNTTAVALDLPCASASVYVGPCIAGHIGADTAAAALAEGPHRGETVQLLVDVGTNAEIVLGNRDWQFAASSPTGPAFEGAQISCGQRATPGAIERVLIDPSSHEPRFRVIGSPLWSDEPGFRASVSATGITGICGSGIIDAIAQLFLAGVIDVDGAIGAGGGDGHIVADSRTYSYVLHAGQREDGTLEDVRITQNDVRAVQLAKAALRAGIDLLMERAGIEQVDDVRLAGAFGAHIDPLHALVLGLIPDCPVESVRSVGNAAGAGAVRALVSHEQRTEMEAAARVVTRVETAMEPRFQELFVAAMALPHKSASTVHLEAATRLPDRPGPDPAVGKKRRRRRSGGQPKR